VACKYLSTWKEVEGRSRNPSGYGKFSFYDFLDYICGRMNWDGVFFYLLWFFHFAYH